MQIVSATDSGGLWALCGRGKFQAWQTFFGAIDRYWRDRYISVKIWYL